MLIQVSGPDVFRPFDLALVGHQFSGDNIHEGGLALAVGADEPDVLSFQQAEGHVVENRTVAEAVGQVFNI